MPKSRASSPRGFTLIELIVVIAVISILLGMLLPAIQSARESGRRTVCQNNVKQIGLAVLAYRQGHNVFPPNNVRRPHRHSWAAFVLPHMEHASLEAMYRWDVNWDHPDNQPAINTPVKIFSCPSASGPRRDTIRDGITASTTDYAPVPGFSANLIRLGLVPPTDNRRGVITRIQTRLEHLFDGASHTVMFVEDAGRPVFWIKGGRGPRDNRPGGGNLSVRNGRVRGAGWADTVNSIPLHGFTPNGMRAPGPCAINCTNNNEAFGFHPVGVNSVFADGHVQFLRNDIDIAVYAAIITRDGKDIVKQL